MLIIRGVSIDDVIKILCLVINTKMDLNHLQENYLGEKKNEEINHNYLFWATVFFLYINDNTCTKLYFEFTPFLGIFFQATI